MKIKITEGQFNRLKPKLIEQVDNIYRREIILDFEVGNALFKGYEIDRILNDKIVLTYNIDIERRDWGIKNIGLYNISGPKTVRVEVGYYVNEDSTNSEIIELPIDWYNITIEEESGKGIVSIDDTMIIRLVNDKNKNLVIGEIILKTFTL